jgi:ferredoxin-NADP reductase
MVFCAGRIVAKRAASPTVTVLDLHVPSLTSFLPGQWVDFMAPPHTWIGGFSLASSPKDLPLVTLAVKASSQEPSQWVTYKSQVGDAVQVQVGGNSVLRQDCGDKPAVFVAGGIGISPLLSMYRQYTQERENGGGAQARFLYLVSKEEELVFIDELVHLTSENGDGLVLSLTQQKEWKRPLQGATCLLGRDVMRAFLQNQVSQNTIYYICGPPTILEAIDLLEQKGVPSSNVVYEKWW